MPACKHQTIRKCPTKTSEL